MSKKQNLPLTFTCVHVEYKANGNESRGVHSWKIEGKLTLRLLGYVNPFAEEQVAMKGPREGSFSELLSVHIKSWEGSRDVHLLEWGVRLFSFFTAGHHVGADCWCTFPGNPSTMPSLSSTSPIQISVCSINPF